ncbi:MAG: hypothetical protein IT406_03335 [Candidatus Yanofskybacteria bacterium]|nr:hypothetical protein [Candidatus Yanofskybacteria bacterium]
MEQPPVPPEAAGEESTDLSSIIEKMPSSREQDDQTILEAGAVYGQLEKLRRELKGSLERAFGKDARVVDFKPVEGNRVEVLIELGEGGDSMSHVVDLPE